MLRLRLLSRRCNRIWRCPPCIIYDLCNIHIAIIVATVIWRRPHLICRWNRDPRLIQCFLWAPRSLPDRTSIRSAVFYGTGALQIDIRRKYIGLYSVDQWEQSPVGTTLGTVAGQLSSRPITDDTLLQWNHNVQSQEDGLITRTCW